MSAFGGKADVIQGVGECPLIANSGHWRWVKSNRDLAYRDAGGGSQHHRPPPLVGGARGLQANAQGVRGHGGGLGRPAVLEQRLGVTHHRDDNLASGRQIVD